MNRHVPDLERCKRLKELGVFDHPSTLFYYNGYAEIVPWSEIITRYSPEGIKHRTFPAPLASEMLMAIVYGSLKLFKFSDNSNKYSIAFDNRDVHYALSGYLPNALADLLIYLKENGHLEAK